MYDIGIEYHSVCIKVRELLGDDGFCGDNAIDYITRNLPHIADKLKALSAYLESLSDVAILQGEIIRHKELPDFLVSL